MASSAMVVRISKVVVGGVISRSKVPFSHSLENLWCLRELESKLNVRMRNAVVSFLTENMVDVLTFVV